MRIDRKVEVRGCRLAPDLCYDKGMTTTRINHTDHNHANTPAARTACRKEIAQAVAAILLTPIAQTPVKVRGRRGRIVTPRPRLPQDVGHLAGTVFAPKVRSSKKFSKCVQAALHTGGGRCACGWSA